jgi:hypothetical protein
VAHSNDECDGSSARCASCRMRFIDTTKLPGVL